MDVDSYVRALIERDPETARRQYMRKFGIPYDKPLTISMVRHHWELERGLTQAILRSSPQDRPDVIERAYNRLYADCYWLNQWPARRDLRPEVEFGFFPRMIGPVKTIYEVGSGNAELITYLATLGYDCVATEVTSERGRKIASQPVNLAWHATDGVNPAEYETPNSYDVVLSNQVIEHFHPDDIGRHFAGVWEILKPGGRYVFCTPHRLSGPEDLSRAFGLEQPVCLHLKEYTYRELFNILRAAGFSEVVAAYVPPKRIRHIWRAVPTGQAYLNFMMGLEAMLLKLQLPARRPVVAVLRKVAIWRSDVTIVARK
jgi:SAM-dependent methyltransferase